MDVRRTVGGALTRNAVLCQLLWNYAERLEQASSTHGARRAPSFIVPSWSAEQPSSSPSGSRVLTVHAYTSRTDPARDDALDAILQLVHAALTDSDVSASITARRVTTPTHVMDSDVGTVVRAGVWDIAPVGSCRPVGTQRLPRADRVTRQAATGGTAAATPSLN